MPHIDAHDPLLADLNAPQREAVLHRDGPLLVLAGPGSGKTRVITRRAAQLVRSGIPPACVLAITFTNKAADEMKRRIGELGVARGMWVYTFHALGVRLLREFGPLARVEPGFSIYDEADRLRCVKEAMQQCGISDRVIDPERLVWKISDAKNKLLSAERFAAGVNHLDEQAIARVYAVYEAMLAQRNAVDFDDLLMRVAIVLRDHPEVTERLNVRFRYVLIDEYQDTNHAQYLIARSLSKHHRNICATGDPDQSIYGWRGADLNNILEFERDYPDARVVRLEQNYRSVARVLDVADRLIGFNRKRKAKKLWTENPPGEPVRLWRFSEDRDEAEKIADTIQALHRAGRRYSDFAIFYRVNALSRGLEEALRHRAIPYQIARGVAFYGRKEIKDVLAYLRVLVNPADRVALLRIINEPARGIGDATIDRLMEAADAAGEPLLATLRRADRIPSLRSAARRLSAFVELLDQLAVLPQTAIADLVSVVLKKTGLEDALREERDDGGEDRLANVQELVTAALRYEQEAEEPTLADFLSRTALTSDQDSVDPTRGCVMMMTLHAAKGLEFPVVFLTGLEQGLLPHERSLKGDDVEEERRLCFVGLTRARQQLYVSYAEQRLLRGVVTPRARSQFMSEIEHPDATRWEDFGTRRPAPSRRGPDAGGEFDPDTTFFDAGDGGRRTVPSAWPARRGIRRAADPDETFIDNNRPTRRSLGEPDPPIPVAPPSDRYVGWKAGTLVRHERYGPGQVVWIRPGDGQTRASIKFAGYGEKTFILELSPISKLER